VLAAGEAQALWPLNTLAVTGAGGDLRATPPATGRDYCGEQAHAKRGRACPPMSQVRYMAVTGRLGS
jgi:hypothetical protein